MINNIPIYSQFDCIYTGPHLGADGKLDSRIWFSVPISLDVEEGTITYLIFPYGGKEDEVLEVATDFLTGEVIDGPPNT